MRLTASNLAAVKSTGILPVFAYALAGALVLGAVSGGWAVWRWNKGAVAIQHNTQLRADLAQLQKAAESLRDSAAQSDIDYRAAIERMSKIADEREQDRERNRQQFEAQREALSALLDTRPDLRSNHAGDDVLRHWRKSNSRPATKPTTTAPAVERSPAVPGPATTGKRHMGDFDREPRRGGRDVPRLPEHNSVADRKHAGMAANIMDLVLQCGRAAGYRGAGLCA